MKKLILNHLLAAASLFAVAVTPTQAVLIDFNDSSDLNTFFNATGNASTFGVPAPNTQGLSGSGSIAPSDFFVTGARVFTEGFNGTSSDFSISIYFQFDNPTAGAGFGAGFYMGFGPTATYNPSLNDNTGASDNHFLVGFQPRTTTGGTSGTPITKYAMFLQEKDAGFVSNTSFTTLTNDLVLGNWYYLDMQFSYDVDGYDLTAQLFDSANDGTVGAALAGGTVTGTDLLNSALSDGSDVFAFIGGSGGGPRGFENFDNFELIPEPTSAALLISALGLCAMRRRRRSS